jgi:methyl-accepting chemotaxis protein
MTGGTITDMALPAALGAHHVLPVPSALRTIARFYSGLISLYVPGWTHRLRRLSVHFVIWNQRCRSAMPEPTNLFATLPPDLKNDGYPDERSSVGKRDLTPLTRFLIIFCIGVSATLAWLASSQQQPSGLTPEAKPVSQAAPDVSSRTASSPDQQQANALLLNLDAVRQSIDRIATSIASSQGRMTSSADRIATTQEQMARSIDRIATTQEQIGRSADRMATTQEQMARSLDQLTAGQEQMTRKITKLQEIEQSARSNNSEPSPRPASASAPKPLPRPASVLAPKPLPRESQEPTVP